jgi:hypothetical protein
VRAEQGPGLHEESALLRYLIARRGPVASIGFVVQIIALSSSKAAATVILWSASIPSS